MKRLLFVPLLLAACPSSNTKTECMIDSDCGGDVCARDGECLPASEIYPVRISWTIRGSAANASSCAASPNFYIQFDGPSQQDTFGYEPVPCDPGQFTIDKLPKRFTQAEIGVGHTFLDAQPISSAASEGTLGIASFDLYP